MPLFSGQPNSNSRAAALADVKRKQANTSAPTAHQSKVPSVISRTICPPSEAPVTMQQRPDKFENYRFVGVTIEKLNVLRLLPGHKEPSMIKLPFLVAKLALNNRGVGEDGARSSITLTATQADLVKWKHPDAGRIAKPLHDYYKNNIVKPGHPQPAAAPRHAASASPAQKAQQRPQSFFAQLKNVFS